MHHKWFCLIVGLILISGTATARAESLQSASPTPAPVEAADSQAQSNPAPLTDTRLLAAPAAGAQTRSCAGKRTDDYPTETLFNCDILTHGGYGAVGNKITSYDGKIGHMVGGRGAWIINHSFLLGGGGYGASSPDIEREFNGEMKKLHFGYGGMELGYVFMSNRLIHLTIQTLIGAGGIGYVEEIVTGRDSRGHDTIEYEGEHDAFFVAEPMVYVEMNVTEWFRISVGGGYRYITGVNLPGVDDATLRGASGELLFKFGYF